MIYFSASIDKKLLHKWTQFRLIDCFILTSNSNIIWFGNSIDVRFKWFSLSFSFINFVNLDIWGWIYNMSSILRWDRFKYSILLFFSRADKSWTIITLLNEFQERSKLWMNWLYYIKLNKFRNCRFENCVFWIDKLLSFVESFIDSRILSAESESILFLISWSS